MQSLTKKHGTLKVKFRTEKDRQRGIDEMFNSSIRSSSLGNHKYEVTRAHLEIFESKDIRYDILD